MSKPGGRGSQTVSPGWPVYAREGLYDSHVPWSNVGFLFPASGYVLFVHYATDVEHGFLPSWYLNYVA
jgi:hypothetical protein